MSVVSEEYLRFTSKEDESIQYLNIPKANVRERSEKHYGTAMLYVENPEEIYGLYFLDRKTPGDMRFYS